jgi:hypothetical protein
MPVLAARTLAALLVLALGVGCDRRAADSAAAAPAAPTADATPSAAAVPPPAPTPASAAPPTPAPADATPAALPVVAMDAEGIRFIDAATGSARLLPFNSTTQRELLAALRKAQPGTGWGQPEATDCGTDVVLGTNGLGLSFRDGRFLGWSIDPPSTVGTVAGLRIGTPRPELEAVLVPEVMESTLGTEFVAGGIAGLFDSPKPNARITHLWSGELCIAR